MLPLSAHLQDQALRASGYTVWTDDAVWVRAYAAEALGITEGNLKVRLLRARLQLREILTRLLGDDRARVSPPATHDREHEHHEGRSDEVR